MESEQVLAGSWMSLSQCLHAYCMYMHEERLCGFPVLYTCNSMYISGSGACIQLTQSLAALLMCILAYSKREYQGAVHPLPVWPPEAEPYLAESESLPRGLERSLQDTTKAILSCSGEPRTLDR